MLLLVAVAAGSDGGGAALVWLACLAVAAAVKAPVLLRQNGWRELTQRAAGVVFEL